MPFVKQGDFTFKHANQPDDIYKYQTADKIKQNFDSQAEEIKATFNKLVDDLASVTIGNSGAKNIGSEAINGVTGNNVHDQLKDLYYQLSNVVLGQIPESTVEELRTDNTKPISVEVRTDDPVSPELGRIWFRSDL